MDTDTNRPTAAPTEGKSYEYANRDVVPHGASIERYYVEHRLPAPSKIPADWYRLAGVEL